ncbi:MAG: ABC transporter substrate-binding protein [Proteobacteria bacterium]|nr:ABC transporter substrate-binding protein [Pseudomonadota bacterium]
MDVPIEKPARRRPATFACALVLAALGIGAGRAAEPAPAPTTVAHGIAMHGAPKYGPSFTHFAYANPDAPKGGTVTLSAIGTFDTFNPFTLKGVPAEGIDDTFETLMVSSADEAFSEYGLIAETIEYPPDRSWVAFTLRREARWHDGRPVTPEDVIFSFETLKRDGRPFYRAYYRDVAKAEKVGERTVRFTFTGGDNRELPLIVGQLPILPRHYWQGRDFTKTTLEPPLGSGPYRVESFEPGRSVTFSRVKDYWGEKLPVRRGLNNFDLIRYEYYRDATVALEAFKAGAFDFRQENSAKNWATAYDFPAARRGQVWLEKIPHEIPTGMQAFVFNTRRGLFRDRRVRRALAYAFDFEWSNENLFYGQYTRTESYFSNSELASRGLPQGEELEILERYRGRIPDEVFTAEYHAPSTAPPDSLRGNLLKGLKLLDEAGWVVRDLKLVNRETGQPFRFEILLVSPQFERIALPFAASLRRLGIEASVRTVDTAQYVKRIERFDFDVVVNVFGQSLSPGNEQRDYWGSEKADEPGSRNLIGVKDRVIDDLVDLVIRAPDRESLIARTRALDRVLLWNHYVIPQWHLQSFRVAYWDRFVRPKVVPKYALGFETWWIDPAKAEALERGRRELAESGKRTEVEAEEKVSAGRARLSLLLAIAGGVILVATVVRSMLRNRRR